VLPPQSADAYTRFRGPVSWQLLVLRPSLDVNSFAFLSNKTNTYLTYLRTYLAESSPNTEEHQVVCVCARIIICAAEKFGQGILESEEYLPPLTLPYLTSPHLAYRPKNLFFSLLVNNNVYDSACRAGNVQFQVRRPVLIAPAPEYHGLLCLSV